jgi:hypothetical protein
MQETPNLYLLNKVVSQSLYVNMKLIVLIESTKLSLYTYISSGPAEYYCHYTVAMNIQAESSACGKVEYHIGKLPIIA